MTNPAFSHVLLMGRTGVKDVPETLNKTHEYLLTQHVSVSVESTAATMMPDIKSPTSLDKIPDDIDLILVIGGDGSLLNAAQIGVKHSIPVLGIHRGRLGFLTDIPPTGLDLIGNVLKGQYTIDKRHLFVGSFMDSNGQPQQKLALNDIILMPSRTVRMIEFDTFANEELVYEQRADGLIIATPTGSTAYALSGGGPILHPKLDATVLVAKFPHTLSSRPIVLDANTTIRLHINSSNESPPCLSFDGRNKIELQLDSDVHIKKHDQQLTLIHPKGYNYFHILREKLGWERHARRTEQC